MTAGSRGSTPDSVFADLRAGLVVHLPYALFSVVLVCCSVVAGALSYSVGSARLSRLPFTELTTGILTQTRPLGDLIRADTELVSVLIVGVITFGAATALALVAQGVVIGFFLGSSFGSVSPAFLLVSLAPHGVIKLVGLALAAAVSFRLAVRGVAFLLGRRQYLTNKEWRQSGLVVVTAWIVVVVAAAVESVVTVRLTRLLV